MLFFVLFLTSGAFTAVQGVETCWMD